MSHRALGKRLSAVRAGSTVWSVYNKTLEIKLANLHLSFKEKFFFSILNS